MTRMARALADRDRRCGPAPRPPLDIPPLMARALLHAAPTAVSFPRLEIGRAAIRVAPAASRRADGAVRGGGQVPVAALLCGLARCLEDGSVKAEMVQVRVGCARALPARR
jgi:hypothetical protein